MKNQFIYTQEHKVAPTEEGGEETTQLRTHSFNMDMVTRTIGQLDGGLLVILDDLHEREEMGRSLNQNGKPIMKMQKVIYQSEILLTNPDAERFFDVSDVSKDTEYE